MLGGLAFPGIALVARNDQQVVGHAENRFIADEPVNGFSESMLPAMRVTYHY